MMEIIKLLAALVAVFVFTYIIFIFWYSWLEYKELLKGERWIVIYKVSEFSNEDTLSFSTSDSAKSFIKNAKIPIVLAIKKVKWTEGDQE